MGFCSQNVCVCLACMPMLFELSIIMCAPWYVRVTVCALTGGNVLRCVLDFCAEQGMLALEASVVGCLSGTR